MEYVKQILKKELASCEKALQKSQDAFYDNRITYAQRCEHRENLNPKIKELKKALEILNQNL